MAYEDPNTPSQPQTPAPVTVDFHANLTHHFHLDLTHPGS